MSFRVLALAGLIPLLGLAGCGGAEQPWKPAPAKGPPAAEAGYVAPPATTGVRFAQDGVTLEGAAAPGAKVMLGTPTGETLAATADAQGRWTAQAPPVSAVRLYGLFMTIDGRKVMSEGYLVLTPDGRAALLRAGTGARVLAQGSRPPRILAVDYDRDGGAVISGIGTPDADVGLRVDRSAGGGSVIDGNGRFAIAMVRPLGAGDHTFEVAGEGGEDSVILPTVRPEPVGAAVFRAGPLADGGWRIDWTTPSGGVQTTLLPGRRA